MRTAETSIEFNKDNFIKKLNDYLRQNLMTLTEFTKESGVTMAQICLMKKNGRASGRIIKKIQKYFIFL